MAYSFIASASAVGTSSGNTTSAIDTTGANLLIVVVGFQQGGSITVSDSKGNTWNALTASSNAGAESCQIYYSIPSSVGTSHTFTVSGSSVFASICAAAFSGGASSSPFDQQNGNNNNSATIQPGSITPTENNELVITGVAWNLARSTFPPTIDGGFTVQESENFSGGAGYGSALAYLIQTTTAAANPTWNHGNSASNSARIASFKVAAAGSGTVSVQPALLTLNVG